MDGRPRSAGPGAGTGVVAAAVLLVAVILSAVSLALALGDPAMAVRPERNLWLDVLAEPTLPTWWSTTALSLAALAHAAAGMTARSSGRPEATAWFAGAGMAGMFSLAEHSGLHDRLDGVGRQLFGGGAWTDTWLLVGAVVAVPAAGTLVAVAARVGPPSRWPLALGGVLVPACAVGGELASAALGPGSRPGVVVAHLGDLGETAGAALLLLAALRAVTVSRGPTAVSLRHPGAGTGPDRPLRVVAAWRWLVGVSVGLSLLSLVVVLGAPVLEPGLREWRLYVDVLVEANLPTWWSAVLLLCAAVAHLLTACAARAAAHPSPVAVAGWLVTATVLAALSLDDHTQLHERSEHLGRLMVTPRGDYPFYWLLPGAVAGLVLVVAVAALAVQVRGRTRRMLVTGIGVLLGCALGLDAVQGLFMAAGDEGLGFVLGYHVEEIGENIAALLLLGAAATATRLRHGDGELSLGYTGGDEQIRSAVREPSA